MAEIRFSIDWLSADDGNPIFRDTAGQLNILLDGLSLTKNTDIWSKTVRDPVLISAYPLALWMVASWWRLNFEPLPKARFKPSVDWRMAHELGAANHGYVWPAILFASDGEMINIWAEAIASEVQSVSYLNSLKGPQSVDLQHFIRETDNFIETVISRLHGLGHSVTDLSDLWSLVKEDRGNPDQFRIRRIEAQMGFDPEECPQEVIYNALELGKQIGTCAMQELAPIYGRPAPGTDFPLDGITHLANTVGIVGRPEFKTQGMYCGKATNAPWMQGVNSARKLRAQMPNQENPVSDVEIYNLLGLTKEQVEAYSLDKKAPVSVVKPEKKGLLSFIPRKRHPDAKRFEYARFLGGCFMGSKDSNEWMVSSELATAQQKRQRAFAAEFLCPVNSLTGFLSEDFSESKIEDASDYFGVSEKTIMSILMNNGYLDLSG